MAPRRTVSSNTTLKPHVAPGTYNWDQAFDRYMNFTYTTYEDVARGEGMSIQAVKAKATEGKESWADQRKALSLHVHEQVKMRVRSQLGEKYAARIMRNLELSDKLKGLAERSLDLKLNVKQEDGSEKEVEVPLNRDQALRAIAAAVDIDKTNLLDLLGDASEAPTSGQTHMTSIEKLVLVLQGSQAPAMGPKLVEILQKKLA